MGRGGGLNKEIVMDTDTDRTGRDRKRITTSCREGTVSGKDITRKRRRREQLPRTIIRQEPERPDMQNTGEGTQKRGEEERTKKPDAKPKGRCGGSGVSSDR